MTDQVKIDYTAAADVAKKFDDAQSDLEANASTMPSSVDGGEGTEYIINAILLYSDAAGTFAQSISKAAGHVRTGVDLVSGVDANAAASILKLAKELPDEH